MAVNRPGTHLHLRKGSTHAIAIDNRYSRLRCGQHWFHGIGSTDFTGNHCVNLVIGLFFQSLQCTKTLFALFNLFDTDNRCTYSTKGNDPSIIRQLIKGNDLYLATLP